MSADRPTAALRRLLAHVAWANQRALATLRAQATPTRQAVALLAHVLGAEHVWLSRLEGRQAAVAIWPALDLDECEALARENAARFEALLDQLDAPGALGRQVHYRTSTGVEFDSTAEDILLQVVTHGSYHRGQVALLVRGAGDAPQPTDYIAFARGAPAAAASR